MQHFETRFSKYTSAHAENGGISVGHSYLTVLFLEVYIHYAVVCMRRNPMWEEKLLRARECGGVITFLQKIGCEVHNRRGAIKICTVRTRRTADFTAKSPGV